MTDNIKPFLKATTPDNSSCIALLEEMLQRAKDGEVLTVGIVGKCTGGDWITAMSNSESHLEDAAMLIELGIRRLGFAQRRDAIID